MTELVYSPGFGAEEVQSTGLPRFVFLMKLYIASRFTNAQFLSENVVPVLQQLGHTVTSRWIQAGMVVGDAPRDSRTHDNPAWVKRCNEMSDVDLEDVDACDILLIYAENLDGAAGMYFEHGYAYARGKTVVWIGMRAPSVFSIKYHHWFRDWESLKEALTSKDRPW